MSAVLDRSLRSVGKAVRGAGRRPLRTGGNRYQRAVAFPGLELLQRCTLSKRTRDLR